MSKLSLLHCVVNKVLNNLHVGPFSNSLASLGGLYGNFELSFKRYGIDFLKELAKHLMISSARKPKTFQSTS